MTNQVPGAQTPPYSPAPETIPGKTLGIVAVILTFVVSSVVGLILGYVARNQSRAVGYENTPAKVAIIAGWILTALGLIAGIIAVISIFALAASSGSYGS
ncbi:MAG: DUF4190 domain-containing protein [Microbacterium sp.]|uniref:ABC-type Na+ efflux pump permease subunit n=1 Tax=Microbacterium natoriense TaxID=284570 RepID=A0AAW8EYS3_9MICO|nr:MULTISPECIES: DUF4190 domain-containing protein [Microbacterium]MBW8761880.1 DUF4190 domain-containing protein [Microbacterium sp.]MDQ0647960.1 ABC-type Na+ efflux pump permease subunit [Microbacterium natoriense]